MMSGNNKELYHYRVRRRRREDEIFLSTHTGIRCESHIRRTQRLIDGIF